MRVFRDESRRVLASAVRSASGGMTCTGLPDSRPSHAFNCSGEVTTDRPWREIGIPVRAHRCTTEIGSPKNDAICRQPLSVSG